MRELSERDRDKWISAYRPIGFLEQLGETLGQPVGIGNYGFGHYADANSVIRLCVNAEIETRRNSDESSGIGKYTILFSAEDYGSVEEVTYEGRHPMVRHDSFSRDQARFTIRYNGKGRFERLDSHDQVTFPGLAGFPIDQDLSLVGDDEIVPGNLLLKSEWKGPGRYEIHLHTYSGISQLGYVKIASQNIDELGEIHEPPAVLGLLQAAPHGKAARITDYMPFVWEVADKGAYRVLVNTLGHAVMDLFLDDLREKGFSFAYGEFSKNELQQIPGIEDHGFRRITMPSGAYIEGVYYYCNLEQTGLTLAERRHLQNFAGSRPNLNVGLTQISELCRNMSPRDIADLSQHLGITEANVVRLLSNRLTSVMLRDIQRSPQAAKEAIERLKGGLELGE